MTEIDRILADGVLLSRAIRDIRRLALAKIDPGFSSLLVHRLVLDDTMDDYLRARMHRGALDLAPTLR